MGADPHDALSVTRQPRFRWHQSECGAECSACDWVDAGRLMEDSVLVIRRARRHAEQTGHRVGLWKSLFGTIEGGA